VAYGDKDDYILNDGEHTLSTGKWSWMNFIGKGEEKKELFAKHCPVTTRLLDEVIGKDLMKGTPFSYTFFSTMKPGTSINPHYGATNIKLRCHFPLFVPEEAFLRVAGDPRAWEEGKMIIFDDSYEHEAANLSDSKERVILLIDIWHPELIEDERQQIKAMFDKMKQMIKDR
jgi:aspartate beta-hydroxylase